METNEHRATNEFKEFLHRFVDIHLAKAKDEKLPPFRLVEDQITSSEIRGHGFGWAADYLHAHKCPLHWANYVCAETIKRIADVDVTPFIVPSSSVGISEGDGPHPTTCYDASKLCELTFTTVEKVLKDWMVDLPAKYDESCSTHRHKISQHAIKNTRRKMEDRHIVAPLLHLFTDVEAFRDCSLYAVFDGHGGSDASSYAAAHFLFNLVNQPSKDKSEALLSTFRSLDADFTAKASRERLQSGTTGVAVLVDPEAIYISWLGDSQAILVRSGGALSVMSPHKPEGEEEKARITALGGCVVWFGTWRVNGNLAVSRALGDVEHKPFISSEAECKKVLVENGDEYIIVACDGLWDVISHDRAVLLVYQHIQSGKSQFTAAEALVKAAKEEGSGDNITVIIVFIKDELCPPVASAPSKTSAQSSEDAASVDAGASELTASVPIDTVASGPADVGAEKIDSEEILEDARKEID